MSIAQGVSKQTRIARQAAKGTAAVAADATAQIMRRETSVFELQKETYTTESEISSTQQLRSSRHGIKVVNGKLDGILTPGTYDRLFSALMRKDFAVGPTTGPLTDVAAAVTAGAAGTFTTVGGDFLVAGFKIGQVVRCTGWLTTGTPNNAHNFLITALTDKIMTVLAVDGVAVGPKVAGDSVTISTPGKVSYVPTTGHTNIYHTVEEWYPDITPAVSEKNVDCVVGSADITLPGSGNSKVAFAFTGLDQTKAAAVYFTGPLAESTSQALTAASGVLIVNGAVQAIITSISMKIDAKVSPAEGVVGTNLRPDVFRGKVNVSGSLSCYFDGGSVPDLFINETSTSIVVVLTTGGTANADFIALSLPQVDLNSSTPEDGEQGLKRSYNFQAELCSTGGAALANHMTTLMMQDSLAV